MAKSRKIQPKTQAELSQDAITPYTKGGYDKTPLPDPTQRALNRRVVDSDADQFNLGLKDIDEAIFYYFNNVIKPTVTRNGEKIVVPILYGSPERWEAVQKDGFYRDSKGKLQVPLIMLKRETVEKNRSVGNKMDANNPNNFGVFEKRYSQKNVYDRFSVLTNRKPVVEYQAVVIPDYVNITYSCIIFTDYVEQMNKLVESINYASDSYWGDPSKYSFRVMIDSFNTATEISQGADRSVRTSFSLNLFGHIIPTEINTLVQGSKKYFSKSAIKFTIETESSGDSI